MSAFTGDLCIVHQPKAWWEWRLAQDLQYEVGAEGSGRWVVVPKGFPTDGATVPRLLWAILPSWGTYSRAAVVHDYLLVCLKQGTPHVEAMRRKDADRIFLEAMAVCGTSRIVRYPMYWAVRLNSIIKDSGFFHEGGLLRSSRSLRSPVRDTGQGRQEGANEERAPQAPDSPQGVSGCCDGDPKSPISER